MLARGVRNLSKDKFAVEFEAGKTYHVTLALAGIDPVVSKMESSGTASSDGLF